MINKWVSWLTMSSNIRKWHVKIDICPNTVSFLLCLDDDHHQCCLYNGIRIFGFGWRTKSTLIVGHVMKTSSRWQNLSRQQILTSRGGDCISLSFGLYWLVSLLDSLIVLVLFHEIIIVELLVSLFTQAATEHSVI